MLKFVLVLTVVAAFAARVQAGDQLERAPAAQALPTLTQQLYDAVAPGDNATWDRYLSKRFIYTDESGARMDKAALLAEFGPLPPGLSGSIVVRDAKVSDFGAFAVMTYDNDEHELVFDQALHVLYRATDTWQRERGAWRLVASQVMVVAQDSPPLPIDTTKLADYAGVYSLSGKWRYRVELRGETLFGGREGRELKPLTAIGDNVFVAPGDPLAILHVFVRRRDGRVDRIVERRKFADTVWLRMDDPVPTPVSG